MLNITPVEMERYLALIAQPHFSNNSLAPAHSPYNANLLHRMAHQKDLIYQVQKPRPVILSMFTDLPAFYFDLINLSLFGAMRQRIHHSFPMKTVFSGPMALRIHLTKSGVELAKVYNCPPRSVRISIRVDDPDLPAFYFGPLMNSISVRGVWQRIYLSFPMKTASLSQMVLMTTTSNFLQPYLEDKDLENDLNADGIALW